MFNFFKKMLGLPVWLNDNLCILKGDRVRVELGAQVIELEVNDENLSDQVTAPHYQMGRYDAHGEVIGSKSRFHAVDWKSKHTKPVWKVYYRLHILDPFEKHREFPQEQKDKAINYARGLK